MSSHRGATVLAVAALLSIVVAPVSTASNARPLIRWLQMTDAVHGYALGGQDPEAYRLLRTSDGGRSWRDITPGGGTIHPSAPLTIVGRRTRLFSTTLRPGIFAVERSDDGGRTWRESLPFGDRRELGIGQPFAIDARHLYVALDEGAAAGSSGQALYVSGDGGHAWRFVSRTSVSGRGSPPALPFGCDKNGYGFSTPTRGWAGGYCAGGPAFLYRTVDGGRTWRRQHLAAPALCACETSAPRFFTASTGALYVQGFPANGGDTSFLRFYWTSDDGAHWRASDPHAGRASMAISLPDAGTAWVATTRPGTLRGPYNRLVRTSDAGRHWQTLTLPFDTANDRFDVVNATVAYAFDAVNRSSSIRVTHNGGRSWQTIHATE
ncbi:MAG TPA: hypothetical protein VIG35_07435 [Gaiellaceae bacterium]